MTETFVGTVDLAQVSLYLFWLFFAGLVFWLQRENMREGYPLQDEDGNPSPNQGLFSLPEPKTFKLPHGRGDVSVPSPDDGDKRPLALRRTAASDGSPFEPTGDPLVDGVGPASWAERRDAPELDAKGHPKIVPMRMAEQFAISAGRDPRGLPVQAHDEEVIGVITDLWIDEPEQLVRYLEIALDGEEAGSILLPMPLARIRSDRVRVHALNSPQFANVPRTRSPNQVTMLEEEKICAYYAGGKLYASPERLEPQL
ncbi:MAG: photosynthetic reaction center subunit H [Pseudomonadota bacterium]